MRHNQEDKMQTPRLIYKKIKTKQKPRYSLSMHIESGMKILEADI